MSNLERSAKTPYRPLHCVVIPCLYDLISRTSINAHEFIQRLLEGYHMIVGERGQKLLGGQQQRLALLSAHALRVRQSHNQKSPNSDSRSGDFCCGQRDGSRDSAVVSAGYTESNGDRDRADRLSTIRHADCIYVMEHGQFIESGTHEQLLERNGTYAKLWRVQSELL